jgi:hypothetical protein
VIDLRALLSKWARPAMVRRAAVRGLASLLLGISLWMAPAASAKAADVVFVLGEDTHGNSGYFSAAESYYRYAMPGARTVTTLRSLAEVREYLVRSQGESPWTRIVLVAHGSPWGGLVVPVFSDGARASLAAIEEAIVTREFPALPPGVIAADGSIVLESCGLGRREEYLRAMGELFRTDGGSAPKVEAAQGFVTFHASKLGAPQRSELPIAFRILRGSLAEWTPARLSGQAAQLRETLAGSQAQVSRHPISVTVDYPESSVSDPRRAERLAKADPNVLRQLRSLGISATSLRWRSETVGNDRGIRVFGEGVALIAYGQAPDSRLPLTASQAADGIE